MRVNNHPGISIDPKICSGKPVITGTRLPVSLILGALSAGQSAEELLADYPSLKKEDISAALAFATELSDFQDISSEAA
ncbi:MAG TPA: DUF433 domain-containing protein [Oligoflexia bacterium]|nr:DUF433 domain-containing protein [Oligoflexia bacterium]HMP48926.1 DUF433 domain-containing protein [Oligoflexia bacterium]